MQIQDVVKFRQGDVLFKVASSVPAFRGAATALLHKGENHHHSLRGGAWRVGTVQGAKILRVTKATTLVHEEHGPIKLAKGDYAVEIQQEYSHWEEEARNVAD